MAAVVPPAPMPLSFLAASVAGLLTAGIAATAAGFAVSPPVPAGAGGGLLAGTGVGYGTRAVHSLVLNLVLASSRAARNSRAARPPRVSPCRWRK